MKAITQQAAEKLKATLDSVNAPDDRHVRFVASPTGMQAVLDVERPDDQSFDHDGRTVLVVDPDTAAQCSELTLDFQDGKFCFS